MEQLSLFDEEPWPQDYDGLEASLRPFLDEGEIGDDLLTFSTLKSGRSYFTFGKKAFMFTPAKDKKAAVYKLPADDDPKKFVPVDPGSMSFGEFKQLLLEAKRAVFRSLVSDKFACCNSFKECSKAGGCIKKNDRFYNGCYYRKNLDAGKVFY